MIITAILCAIAISIILGYITRINVGIFAMIFAYLIGAFLMDISPKQIISFFPVSIFFVIFSVCLFYNFASVNGTLENIASHLMFYFQSRPYLLPFAVFLVAALIAALGAGFYTVLAFMAPITFLLCEKMGLDRIAGAMAINYGALGGANFMTSQSGIIFRKLMEDSGVDQQVAFINSWAIFLVTIILPFFVISFFVLKDSKKMTTLSLVDKPNPFNPKQKKTLALMILMMLLVLTPPILHLIFNTPFTKTLNNKMDIGLIAMIFVGIALLLKLANEKDVISLVPWGTLIMICGVGMLIALSIKAGTITLLTDMVQKEIPSTFIPFVMCIFGAFMSLFSSTLGVVTPTLFPIVPHLADSSSNATLLFIAIVVGAQSSAISPFSSGGSLILGACPSKYKDQLFKDLLFKAIPIGFSVALLATAVCVMIF